MRGSLTVVERPGRCEPPGRFAVSGTNLRRDEGLSRPLGELQRSDTAARTRLARDVHMLFMKSVGRAATTRRR
jgi:hypothetical protein